VIAGLVLLLLAGMASAVHGEPCAAATVSAGLNSWPKCIDVTFRGEGVSGLPPITYTWEVSNGYRFSGNPGVLWTQNLDPGSYSVQLRVSNTYGSHTSLPVFFTIESLAPGLAPVWTNLGARVVEFQAQATGATEYQWVFGDGATSPWLQGCAGRTVTHAYATTGTYSARLRVRNCEDPQQARAFSVIVTDEQQLDVLLWEAVCPLGFCLFDTGETVFFTTLVQGNPTTFSFDWDGDGLTDEVRTSPVSSHVYHHPGTFLPRLTITRGTQTATFVHELPLVVLPASGPIFADGFENGTTAAWSRVVGAHHVEGERP
jgi:PKD domain-containing protein